MSGKNGRRLNVLVRFWSEGFWPGTVSASVPGQNLHEGAVRCGILASHGQRACVKPPVTITSPSQPAMPENFLDHIALPSLDEADDLHRSAALGTEQRIHT